MVHSSFPLKEESVNRQLVFLKVQPRRKESLLTCLADLFNSIATQKKKVGVIPPKKFISRLRKENGEQCLFILNPASHAAAASDRNVWMRLPGKDSGRPELIHLWGLTSLQCAVVQLRSLTWEGGRGNKKQEAGEVNLSWEMIVPAEGIKLSAELQRKAHRKAPN